MKVPRGAILGLLLLGSSAWAAPFQMSYSGLFPANRDGKGVQTYLLLIDQPRQVKFNLTDEKGNPQPNVRVVEVSTSGTSGGIKNAEGILQADLPESGIYELKISADAAVTGQIGFILKVVDTGTAPTAAVPTAPVVAPAPNPTPAPPIAEPPPVATPVSPAPVPLPKSPEKTTTEAASATTSPAVQPKPETPQTPIVPNPLPLVIGKKYPQGQGYADPYRPVEVLFDRPLDAGIVPENVLQVGLLAADGQWKAVPGQWFAAGKNGIRFLPKRLLPGAVYHARVFDPRNQTRIDEFSFMTFPEVRLALVRTAEGIQGDLDWTSAQDVLPGPDGQVVKLETSELVVKAGEKEIARFPFSPDMAPFGNRDDMRFQGRPFGFTLVIPTSRFPGDESAVSMSLFTKIAGREGPLEVARTTLSGGSIVPSAVPASPTAPVLIASVPVVVASEALIPPIPEPTPVKTPKNPDSPVPPKSQVIQAPVVPINDPGLGATILPENEFSAAEDTASAHKCWPRGVTWGPDGALWVVDSQNRRVLKFNDLGQLMLAFGKQGKGTGMLGLPLDLAFGTNEVLISDSAVHTIHVFDFQGTPIRSIGTWGTRPGQVDLPHGIDFADGQIWLAERGNCQIMRFSLDGVFLSAFGRKDTTPGSFDSPIGIRVHGSTVWVMEPKKGRLQRFTREGKYLGGFIAGTVDAAGFDIDPWGCVWVADGEGHRVLRYDSNGKLLVNIESPLGPRPWNPTSVSVRTDGLIAIGDAANRTIRLFRLKKP